MNVDSVVLKALQDVQQDVKEQLDLDISIQEIGSIVESQFIAGNLAFKKGLNIRLPLWGTFVRVHAIESCVASGKLKELKDTMTETEYERKVLEAKLANKAKAKARRAMPRISFKQLQDTDNLVEVKNRFDKVIK